MVVSLPPGLERDVILSPPTPSSHVYSDASVSYGCGAIVASCGWFKVQWPASWSDVAIAQNELVPFVMAAAVWGHQWQGCHVCFHSDNMAVVSVLVNWVAKDERMNHMLRTLFFHDLNLSFCIIFV